MAGGCSTAGEIANGGITAIRTACPTVAVPANTGDITLFDPPASRTESAIDVTAAITNVRSTCADSGDQVVTNVSFDVEARRTNTSAPRDVTLPYYVAVVNGGSAVVAKRIANVGLHFDAGQSRAEIKAQGTASVTRAAATLPREIRDRLTRKRKAGQEDAAVDPMSVPEVRTAVARATFEALVGFQLTNDQLKYNATR